MSDASTRLPTGFEAMQPFAAAWAIAGANNRLQCRLATSATEQVAFFEAVKDIVPSALEYLDQKPLAAFDDKDKRLLDLLLTFAHIALAVEVQRDDEPRHALGARRITITRATSD